jgi:hypothetical protein
MWHVSTNNNIPLGILHWLFNDARRNWEMHVKYQNGFPEIKSLVVEEWQFLYLNYKNNLFLMWLRTSTSRRLWDSWEGKKGVFGPYNIEFLSNCIDVCCTCKLTSVYLYAFVKMLIRIKKIGECWGSRELGSWSRCWHVSYMDIQSWRLLQWSKNISIRAKKLCSCSKNSFHLNSSKCFYQAKKNVTFASL